MSMVLNRRILIIFSLVLAGFGAMYYGANRHAALAATCKADLVVTNFELTNANGQAKKTFGLHEAVYPRVTLSNQGTERAESTSGYTYTQIYRHQPKTVSRSTKSVVGVGIRNGIFSSGFTKTYSSRPGGENQGNISPNKFWTVDTAGVYTARVYVNYTHGACESNFDNNQVSVVYRVTDSGGTTSNIAQAAEPDNPSTTSSTTRGWKNSLIYTHHAMHLTKVGFFNTGARAPYELRQSNKNGRLGQILASGTLASVSNRNYYRATTSVVLDPDSYYVLRVYQQDGTAKRLSYHHEFQDITFLDGTTGSQSVQDDPGVFQTMLVYSITRKRLDFNAAKFRSYGFPNPQSPNPISIPRDKLERWQTYLMKYAVKSMDEVGTDVGIIGAWAALENSFDAFMDNCNDSEFNPNTPCYQWGGGWQVGYGNHPSTALNWLDESMKVMHPQSTAGEVGQLVIDASATRYSPVLRKAQQITYPSTNFGSSSISRIQQGARDGDLYSRHRAATLMKDDAIASYLMARNFRDNIGLNGNLAWKMESWSAYYNRQKVINYIKALYDAGIYR